MSRLVTVIEEERITIRDPSANTLLVTSPPMTSTITAKTVERVVVNAPVERLVVVASPVERVTVSTGMSGGVQNNVFVQPTAPATALDAYLWVQTFANGDLSFWVQDGT